MTQNTKSPSECLIDIENFLLDAIRNTRQTSVVEEQPNAATIRNAIRFLESHGIDVHTKWKEFYEQGREILLSEIPPLVHQTPQGSSAPALWQPSAGFHLAADTLGAVTAPRELTKPVNQKEVHEFKSLTVEQGVVAFLDDGAAVYVRIVGTEPPRQLTLGNTTYRLDIAFADTSLFCVIGLLPAEAARFVRKHGQSPKEHPISWAVAPHQEG